MMGLIKGPTPVQIGGNIIQFESAEEACFGMLDAKRDGLMGAFMKSARKTVRQYLGADVHFVFRKLI